MTIKQWTVFAAILVSCPVGPASLPAGTEAGPTFLATTGAVPRCCAAGVGSYDAYVAVFCSAQLRPWAASPQGVGKLQLAAGGFGRSKGAKGAGMVKQSAMPDGLVSNLTPEQLADMIAYLQSLK